MSDQLHDLYQTIILEHSKEPRHYGRLDGASHQAKGYNPLCGDEVTVFVRVEEGEMRELAFESASCAICKASASLMTEALRGLPVEAYAEARRRVGHLLADEAEAEAPDKDDLAALAGVRKFPSRIKCALLPWTTLEAALSGKGAPPESA